LFTILDAKFCTELDVSVCFISGFVLFIVVLVLTGIGCASTSVTFVNVDSVCWFESSLVVKTFCLFVGTVDLVSFLSAVVVADPAAFLARCSS
jgi:TRAP-type uncharacterized transport system fused permease subunit